MQTGGPRELYDEPTNHYVAGFVGKSNFFAGTIVETDSEGAMIKLDSGRVLRGRVSRRATAPNRGHDAKLAVRPELVHIAAVNGKATFSADVETSARVKNRIFLGEQTEYLVESVDLELVRQAVQEIFSLELEKFFGDNFSVMLFRDITVLLQQSELGLGILDEINQRLENKGNA